MLRNIVHYCLMKNVLKILNEVLSLNAQEFMPYPRITPTESSSMKS